MKCACARADITPAPGVELSGFVARRQPSTGVHDPLTGYALYLQDGDSRLLWLHADVVAFERSDVWRLKTALQEKHGLAPLEVLVTATHTHSGPAVVDLLRCGAYDAAEAASVLGILEGMAAQAISHPEPVEAVFAEGSSGLAIHRRPSENPHIDPRLPVLGFRRADGTFAAVLALYAMHNVAMGGENTLICADVAGRAARMLSQSVPGAPPVLWLNGACGDLNPPSVGPDFAQMEAWGDALAATARAALEAAAPMNDTTLRAAATSLVLAPEPLTADTVDAIAAEQKRRAVPPTSPAHAWIIEACHAAMDGWRAVVTSEDPATRERCSVPVDVQVLSIGEVVFAAIGGEVFSILNDDLRARTGRNVYVVGYANGDGGYLCPERVYDEGGYEPDGAFIFYGTNPIPRGAYERVRDAATELIQHICPVS
jgi:hypothetical protein